MQSFLWILEQTGSCIDKYIEHLFEQITIFETRFYLHKLLSDSESLITIT